MANQRNDGIEVEFGNPGSSSNPVIRQTWEAGLKVLQPSAAQLEEGLALHRDALAIDAFGFLPMAWNADATARWNALVEMNPGGDVLIFDRGIIRSLAGTREEASELAILEAIHVSGLSGMFHTAAEGKSRAEDIKRMAASIRVCNWYGDACRQMHRPADMERAHQQRSFAVAFSVNGPPCAGHLNSLEEEIEYLDAWYNMGVRMMHLSYNRRTPIGTGCAERNDGGLSELGYEYIREMNRVGIIVDVPHSSELTSLQAAETTSKPMMASHVCCKALFDHMRNKSDGVMKAIADTGGVVGMTSRPAFLGPGSDISTLLDHVDHAVQTIGEDHVAIGTDTAYIEPYADDLAPMPATAYSPTWWGAWHRQVRHASSGSDSHRYGSLGWTNWPLMTVGMRMRGYSEKRIRKILGLNLLRVLKANQPD